MKPISEIKTCDELCDALIICGLRASCDAQHENIKAVWEALRHPAPCVWIIGEHGYHATCGYVIGTDVLDMSQPFCPHCGHPIEAKKVDEVKYYDSSVYESFTAAVKVKNGIITDEISADPRNVLVGQKIELPGYWYEITASQYEAAKTPATFEPDYKLCSTCGDKTRCVDDGNNCRNWTPKATPAKVLDVEPLVPMVNIEAVFAKINELIAAHNELVKRVEGKK